MFSIDIRETIIPFSLLKITNCFKCMKTEEIMEIVGIDEDIISDLKNILPPGKFELIETETINNDSSYSRIWLKKTD